MWTQDVEAILHCINSVQEAVELTENPFLETVFSANILGRLPSTGSDRVRVTALNLIGKSNASSFAQLYLDISRIRGQGRTLRGSRFMSTIECC